LAERVAGVCDGEGVLFVADRNAARHASPLLARLGRSTRVESYLVDAAESRKTLSLVEAVMVYATARGLTRDSVIVAMGGGLVGNIAGLAAALLFRGTRLVHLPTTPIAAFDAVVSVKQGVNLSSGKNLCGTYHAPTLIACDLDWLTTVPHRELLTGLAEMAKNILAVAPRREADFMAALRLLSSEPRAGLGQMLDIGVSTKSPFLRGDPQELGAAIVFEYGHTVGHALEFGSRGTVGHGEAVAWGMLAAAETSRSMHLLDETDLEKHYQLISQLRLPRRRWLADLSAAALGETLGRDNKRGHLRCGREEVPMVLLDAVGRPHAGDDGRPLTAVPRAAVRSAWDTVVRSLSRVAA
jgi:3-dehydroquinate synthase/2-deoxy-scyllo-inosose synthase